MEQQNRLIGFSLIRVISCIAVVFLHAFFLAATYAGINSSEYLIFMCIRNFFLWSVPCFVMVSGALLLNLNRVMSFKKLFGKYISKVAIALVVFTIINTVYSGFVDNISAGDTAKAIFTNLITGTGWPHMWYLYLLLAMYLTLPFFRSFIKAASRKTFDYMILMMFVVLSVIPGFLSFFDVTSGIYLWTNTIYPLYFLLGYHLMYHLRPVRKKYFIILFVVSVLITVLLTAFGMNNIVSVYSFPTIVLSSVALFVILKDFSCKHGVFERVLLLIDKTTFGVYLLHLLVLRTLFIIVEPNFVGVIFYGVISFVASVILTHVFSFVVNLVKERINNRVITK